jgi:hypothetical protein
MHSAPNTRRQSDAATRPQDQSDFETQIRFEGCTESTVAARLMRNPLGGYHPLQGGPCPCCFFNLHRDGITPQHDNSS